MRGAFVPLLVLLVLPGAFAAWRLGLLRLRVVRWAVFLLALAALVLAQPAEGLDFVYLKHMTLFLSAAAIVLVLARHYGGRFAPTARQYLGALAALAAASLTVYLNFFSFHGAHTWMHLHDVAHYYLGAKYFDELGYEHLYTAMLRAEAELTPGRFSTLEARDLSTNELVPIRELLLRSDEVKAGFAPERWEDWKRDVQMFRAALGPQFKSLYIDHGFNPTPLWPVMGGTLSRLVPAGSRTGVLVLCLLDPLLLLGAFALVVRAFGWTAALLGVIEFCLIYGASFGWTGGAFLRYVWFACVLAAACFLHRGRFAPAGAVLAVAAALRVFPALFAVPLGLQALFLAWRERRLPRPHLRFFLALGGTGLALFLLTAVQGRGLGAWGEFRQNMSKHMDTVSPNIVGFTPVFAYQDLPEQITLEEMRAQREHYVQADHVKMATLFVAALLAVALIAPRVRPDESMLLAVPLLLTGLNLASYYYVLLVLMVVVWWDRPLRVAGLFGLELATHALLLFEDREQFLYMYRSILLLYLLIAFYGRDLREGVVGLFGPRAEGHGSGSGPAFGG
jgi:hypothetical protein